MVKKGTDIWVISDKRYPKITYFWGVMKGSRNGDCTRAAEFATAVATKVSIYVAVGGG